MAVITTLALLGAGFQTLGRAQSLRDQEQLNILNLSELGIQKEQSAQLFNITLPNLIKQQRATSGMQATQLAKGGVDVGSGSALAFLSEQARVDQVNVNLATWQQQVQQRNLDVERKLTKRAGKQLRREQVFNILGGGTQGLANYLQVGGTLGSTSDATA